ncbi:MAG TPA: helix-turn-helix domain-containing protein [Pseudonocardiaceae bacterium]|nr:helix-turn-helix domain-containing protein [Pseudonocardiaceae bacterium]
MPLRSDWSASTCPIARSLDVLGDPWLVLVLRDAMTGARRYEQFRASLGVADNVLARRLRTMVDAGLLRKVPYRADNRTHDEYHLTEAGADLLPVLNALALWGEKHTTAPRPDAHLTIVHRECGHETTLSDSCSHCGAVLSQADTAWRRPWLADEPVSLTGMGLINHGSPPAPHRGVSTG